METWDIAFNSVQKKPALAWPQLAGKSSLSYSVFSLFSYVFKLSVEMKRLSNNLCILASNDSSFFEKGGGDRIGCSLAAEIEKM